MVGPDLKYRVPNAPEQKVAGLCLLGWRTTPGEPEGSKAEVVDATMLTIYQAAVSYAGL